MFKNKTLMRISLLLVGLLLVAGSSAFIVRNAAAGSCFTDVADGSFWYSVTCWMKNQKISTGYADGTYRPDWGVSRGEMALFVQRSFSNVERVAYLTTGPTAWEANDAYTDAFVQVYWGWSHLHKNNVGTAMFQLSPTIPTSLYNTEMYAKGVKVCFDADPTAYVTAITIKHLWYTSSGYSELTSAVDTADKSGVGCYVVNFASPTGLWGADQITILLEVTYSNPATPLYMGTTTVILQPSTYLAVLGVEDVDPLMLDRNFVAPLDFDPASGLEE